MRPRSPYAVSKLAAEEYCRVFTELYGLETVALRYFNVYGPRQRPDATYAAVIPLFVGRAPQRARPGRARRRAPVARLHVHHRRGRREPRRGRARRPTRARATSTTSRAARRATLLDVLRVLGELLGVEPHPQFVDARAGRRAPQPRRPDRGRRATSASAPRSRSTTASAATVDWLRTLAERPGLRRRCSAASSADVVVDAEVPSDPCGSVDQRRQVLVERQDQRGGVRRGRELLQRLDVGELQVRRRQLRPASTASSGFGITVCDLLAVASRSSSAMPPHARICCESAVASAWMRVMSACCCAVASSNFCCSSICCAATFALTAACERRARASPHGAGSPGGARPCGLELAPSCTCRRRSRRSFQPRSRRVDHVVAREHERGCSSRADGRTIDGRVVGAEVAEHVGRLRRVDPVQHRRVHRRRATVLTRAPRPSRRCCPSGPRPASSSSCSSACGSLIE